MQLFCAAEVPARSDSMAIDAFLSVHCVACLGSECPLWPRALVGLVSRVILASDELAVAKQCPTRTRTQAPRIAENRPSRKCRQPQSHHAELKARMSSRESRRQRCSIETGETDDVSRGAAAVTRCYKRRLRTKTTVVSKRCSKQDSKKSLTGRDGTNVVQSRARLD